VFEIGRKYSNFSSIRKRVSAFSITESQLFSAGSGCLRNYYLTAIFEGSIKSLEGIEFFTTLNELYCDYNNKQLTSLDVSNNARLSYLDCQSNPNLQEIWLKTGQTISTIDKDGHTIIKYKD